MLNNNTGEGYKNFKKVAEDLKKGVLAKKTAENKFLGGVRVNPYAMLSKEQLEEKIKTATEFLKKIGTEDKRYPEANRRYMALEDCLVEKIFCG